MFCRRSCSIWAFIFCARSNKPDARHPGRMVYTAGRRHHGYSQSEIYDIGTEILLLTKNDHNSTQKAPKSIIPQEIKSAGHSHHLAVSKQDLKHFTKSYLLGFAGAVFMDFCSPEGV